jgi:uncharacterized protein (TIGR02246 family)
MALRRVISLLLVPFFLAVAAAQAGGRHDTRVADLSQQWAGYWNAKNLDAAMTLYAPDATFLPTQGKAWHGAAEIRKNCAALLAVYDPHIALHGEAGDVSGTLAYDTGTYEETIDPVKGGKSIAAKGNYLFLFRRGKDGRWRIIAQSWTSAVPVKL